MASFGVCAVDDTVGGPALEQNQLLFSSFSGESLFPLRVRDLGTQDSWLMIIDDHELSRTSMFHNFSSVHSEGSRVLSALLCDLQIVILYLLPAWIKMRMAPFHRWAKAKLPKSLVLTFSAFLETLLLSIRLILNLKTEYSWKLPQDSSSNTKLSSQERGGHRTVGRPDTAGFCWPNTFSPSEIKIMAALSHWGGNVGHYQQSSLSMITACTSDLMHPCMRGPACSSASTALHILDYCWHLLVRRLPWHLESLRPQICLHSGIHATYVFTSHFVICWFSDSFWLLELHFLLETSWTIHPLACIVVVNFNAKLQLCLLCKSYVEAKPRKSNRLCSQLLMDIVCLPEGQHGFWESATFGEAGTQHGQHTAVESCGRCSSLLQRTAAQFTGGVDRSNRLERHGTSRMSTDVYGNRCIILMMYIQLSKEV